MDEGAVRPEVALNNPWAAGLRLIKAVEAAGFEVASWNLYPGTSRAQLVVDLKTKHDEGTKGQST